VAVHQHGLASLEDGLTWCGLTVAVSMIGYSAVVGEDHRSEFGEVVAELVGFNLIPAAPEKSGIIVKRFAESSCLVRVFL
jgi:hypothetical protein